MQRRYLVLSVICCGCMASRGVIDPYSYAPKKPSSFYTQPLDTQTVTKFSSEKPLTLAEILDIALRNNPTTKLTWAKARAAAAQYGSSQSPDFPSLTASYSVQRSKATAPPEEDDFSNFTQYLSQRGPQLQLTYTILDFGQTRATTEAARQALLYADYTHNRQIQTILQQVTADYYSYLSQQQQLVANEADLTTAQVTYDAVKLSLDTGVKDISDLLQAQTQLLQAQIQLVTQKQNLLNAKVRLLSNMGVDGNQSVEIEDLPSVPPIEEMAQTADQLLAIALQKRSDLIAAEAGLKSQEAAALAAYREFFPTLTYAGAASRMISKPGGDLGINFTSTFSLNFPIFSGFSTFNNLKQVQAQKEQAAAQLRQTQLTVIQDVVTSHAQVKTAFETLNFSDALLKTTQQQYDVALARYQAGIGDILELISAQSSLMNARAQQVTSSNQWLTSLVLLSYAAGTLEPPVVKEIR